jgi:hypothetical protein
MSDFQLSLSASIEDIIRFLCKVREFDFESCKSWERDDLRESAEIVHCWLLPAIAGGMSPGEVFDCAFMRAGEWAEETYHSDRGYDTWCHAESLALEVLSYADFNDNESDIETNIDSTSEAEELEVYHLAAMQHGVQGYNEAKGYFTETPSSCGHHCYLGCDVCGG